MPTFILLTRTSPDAVKSPKDFEKYEKEVSHKIKKECPEVKWLENYAILGPYDYLDIVEAPDEMTMSKVVTIIRSFGHAATETWTAIPWNRFRELAKEVA